MASAKDRQRKRRAKLRNNVQAYQSYKEKERSRKEAARAKVRNMKTKAEIKVHKNREKLRIRKYRSVLKAAKIIQDAETLPFASKQAKGKAVKRAQASLPSSPRKRRYVVTEVAKQLGLNVDKRTTEQTARAMSEETKSLVIQFYQSNDVSWQAPGRKDRVIIREKDASGKKTKRTEQTRYMLMSLSEAFQIFSEIYHGLKIGRSKFCELRPKNVKLFHKIPHNVCVCSYHENVRLLLEALQGHTLLSSTFHDFIKQVTCDEECKDCMFSQCETCASFIDTLTPTGEVQNTPIRYQQWQSAEKVEIIGTVMDVFLELKTKLKNFLIHTYIKRRQARKLDSLVASCNGEEVVIQVDFSENATIIQQNEVQAAHWNHAQVTLFTAHAWISEQVQESFVIVSDNLSHTKQSVYVFITTIMGKLKEKYPLIKQINIFSDGATSQFKQRYLFSNLFEWQSLFNVKINWHFFATSHGKGVVDGLGGTVKRAVWREVKTGKSSVRYPQQYADVAQERNPGMNILFIGDSVIQDVDGKLMKSWEGVLAVPHTQKMHFVTPSGPCHVLVADTSDSPEYSLVQIREVPEDADESFCEVTEDPTYCPEIQNDADVNHGFPKVILDKIQPQVPFNLADHQKELVSAIMDGVVPFGGAKLINQADLKEVIGDGNTPQQKWLSNFVIDDYLRIIAENCNIALFSWENFEKSSPSKLAADLCGNLKDMLFVPCNPNNSGHWYLMCVLPSDKYIVVLNSKAGNFVKPTHQQLASKMLDVLACMNHDVKDWTCFTNNIQDVLQQPNSYDCGVYLLMYVRALALSTPIVMDKDIRKYRHAIVFELHMQCPLESFNGSIETEKYYAVDYINKFYVGRAIAIENSVVQFKFLHSVGSAKFDWPRRDDTDEKHISCIFYGPVNLEGCGPFSVPRYSEITALHKHLNKKAVP